MQNQILLGDLKGTSNCYLDVFIALQDAARARGPVAALLTSRNDLVSGSVCVRFVVGTVTGFSAGTVDPQLSVLIGTASYPDMQNNRIIGFFLDNRLHWQLEVKKNPTDSCCGLQIGLRTNKNAYLLTYLLTYTLTYLLTYTLIYLLTYLLTYLQTYLLPYLHTYLFTYLLTHLLIYLLIYLLTHLFTYLHTYLLTYTLTYLLTYLLN